MQKAGDKACSQDLKTEDEEESAVPQSLREGDHSTDIIFTVEGRNLHFFKSVLTFCSPVFHTLLTPEYIQQHSEGIPLPGKKYGTMACFLLQLHPLYSPVTPITDDMLLDLLALAKEYQVEHISTKCEQYIGSQLELHKYGKMTTTDALLTYLTACEQHNLTKHRETLVKLVSDMPTKDLHANKFFDVVPPAALKDVFFVRCQMLEKGNEKLKQSLLDLNKRLPTVKAYLNSHRNMVYLSDNDEYVKNQMSCAYQAIEDCIKLSQVPSL